MGGTAPPRCIRCSATSTGPWWRGQCESTNALAVTRHGQVSSWRPYQGRTRVSSRTGGKERSVRLPDGSCVRRESHAQFFERPGVRSPRPTHLSTNGDLIRVHSYGDHCSTTWDTALTYGRLESGRGDGTGVAIRPEERA